MFAHPRCLRPTSCPQPAAAPHAMLARSASNCRAACARFGLLPSPAALNVARRGTYHLRHLGRLAAEEAGDGGALTARPQGAAAGIILDPEAAQLPADAVNGSSREAGPALQAAVKPRKNDWALRSVVKVFVNKVDPTYALPWQKGPQRSSTGSAFVLDTARRQLLTNAHVVDNANVVYVRRPGIPKKFKATVVCVGKVCDLALLTVEEEDFWGSDLRALEIIDTPELQSPIAVAGYPVGGDSLSVTKGIVSRVAMVRYAASTRLLGIQIDAAINPGNSGGPAFADLHAGKVAGVAFSKNVSSSTDNIGYIIPRVVVDHFLEEYRCHGRYRGVPSPGFNTQTLENVYMRRQLQMPDGRSGVVVVKVDPLSPAAGQLAPQDVVLEVDGVPVADDETIPFRDDERLDFTHAVKCKHVGDALNLRVLRNGKERCVSYPLAIKESLVPSLHGVDCVPSFFIAGGLVFMHLSMPLLISACGEKKWRSVVPLSVLVFLSRSRCHPRHQIVVLVQVLSHECNHGYKFTLVPVETFNGSPVKNLQSLAHKVDTCADDYLRFGLEGGRYVVLDRAAAASATPNILSANGIPADRSQDLLDAPYDPKDDEWEQEAATGAASGEAELSVDGSMTE